MTMNDDGAYGRLGWTDADIDATFPANGEPCPCCGMCCGCLSGCALAHAGEDLDDDGHVDRLIRWALAHGVDVTECSMGGV